VLHFAGHGVFAHEDDVQGRLLLSDGAVQADDIMRLRLQCSLVTLSACGSGVGDLLVGDELMGMARAWMYAGTPSVLASQWNVNDRAASEVMADFYHGMLEGKSKVQSLRQAQLRWLEAARDRVGARHAGRSWAWRPEWDPHLWAPFVLIGDPL